MSQHHVGVSCDFCERSNFSGLRFKCLICFDFDLCDGCHNSNADGAEHSPDHPMQCILPRSEFELYYAGEAVLPQNPQSFTCPHCKQLGFTVASLLEHVTADHLDTAVEVLCPVCAASPGSEPNFVAEDFASHLTLEHSSQTARRRRIPAGYALGGPRSLRTLNSSSAAPTSSTVAGSSGIRTLAVSTRESLDLLSELQRQLSDDIRQGSVVPQDAQVQQLQQLQVQMERLESINRQLDPARRRRLVVSLGNSNAAMATPRGGLSAAPSEATLEDFFSGLNNPSNPGLSRNVPAEPARNNLAEVRAQVAVPAAEPSKFLLAKYLNVPRDESIEAQVERAERSQFVQEVLLATIVNLNEESDVAFGDEMATSVDNATSDINFSETVQAADPVAAASDNSVGFFGEDGWLPTDNGQKKKLLSATPRPGYKLGHRAVPKDLK